MPRMAGRRVLWLAPLMLTPACASVDIGHRADESSSPARAAASPGSTRNERAVGGSTKDPQRATPATSAALSPKKILPATFHAQQSAPSAGDGRSAGGGPPAAGPAVGAEPAPAAVTIDDLERMALESNPSLAQLSSVVHKAQGIRRQVGLLPNPTIGYIADEMGDDGTLGQQGGFVSQTIVTGRKLRLNEIAADQNINQLLWELEAQRYRVRNGVRIQFYETLGAQRRLELTHELERIAEQGADATRRLEQAMRVAELDVLQSELQLSEVRILAANAEAEYEAAWRKLAGLVGRPELGLVPLAGTLEGDSPERGFEAAWEELRSRSPELQAAQARINRAYAQLERERAQPIPNVQAQVTVSHDNAGGDELVGVQLGLPLPVFNRNQGQIDAATAEYHRAVHETRRLELALRNRLADAFQQYQQARRQVEIYEEQILPKARQTLDMTARGYELGRLDLLRVLTARRTYFESSLAAVRAQASLRQADVALTGLLLTGGLNDVPDLATEPGGPGNRDQALNGQ